MTTFYQCSNCGYLSKNINHCPACGDTHQKILGDFTKIEDV